MIDPAGGFLSNNMYIAAAILVILGLFMWRRNSQKNKDMQGFAKNSKGGMMDQFKNPFGKKGGDGDDDFDQVL